MKKKDLLSIGELSKKEILEILKLTRKFKYKKHYKKDSLRDKTLAMIFEKSSTRTRVSFEVGMSQLGGEGIYLNAQDMQLGRGESIPDTARTLSQYVDGIMIRANSQADVDELAKYATVPVINGLSDMYHPCQILGDIFTILDNKKWSVGKDNKKKWNKFKIAYIGDGDNVAHSLITICAKLGINITVATPKEYQPSDEIVTSAKVFAESTGANIVVTNDPHEACQDADVVYTDVWISMGCEDEANERLEKFRPYQVNNELVKRAKPDYLFMHCLPAHRGEEVSGDVIDSENSIVFEQAASRLYVQKAIMWMLMK